MKKLILTAIIAVAIATSSFADPNTINNNVLRSFNQEFKGAENVNWKIRNQFVKVSFVLNKKQTEAFFNFEGDLIATSKTIAFDKLPGNALETITTKYPFPPYVLNECILFTNAEGEQNYFVSFHNAAETIVLKVSMNGIVTEFDSSVQPY